MTDQSTPDVPQVRRVTAEELRRLFNAGGYWERARSGELRQVLLDEGISTLLPDESGPIRSQMISYRNHRDEEVARVHQFVRPDESLAASGKPDPKKLFEGGVLYRLERKRKGVSG